uniref:Uncharacterized protein n=1 Tax=Anguilla anguilla TaxID=7936 RepID=A0A0E9QTD0_ANGAN
MHAQLTASPKLITLPIDEYFDPKHTAYEIIVMFCRQITQKWNFLDSTGPSMSGVKHMQHFTVRISYIPIVKLPLR